MNAMELEGTLKVFEGSLSRIKWRLKPSSKRRLQTDTLAVCSGMRPVVMVDYGGKMPELGDRLCAFVKHCKEDCTNFELLRVMVIGDMVYLIQLQAFYEFVQSSLKSEGEILFVDLENDPPKMTTHEAKSPAIMQLLSAQELFSAIFLTGGTINSHLLSHGIHTAGSSLDEHLPSDSSVLLDLSCCLERSQVTIPTLNGWLLGYPVVYLFGKEQIEHAIYNLSTKSLHVYQIFVRRVGASSKGDHQEELLSFTVPYDLSLEGSNEPWAKSFLARMRQRLEKCKQVWGSLHMDVNGCFPQAIAL